MKLDGGGAFEEAGAVEKVEMGGTWTVNGKQKPKQKHKWKRQAISCGKANAAMSASILFAANAPNSDG